MTENALTRLIRELEAERYAPKPAPYRNELRIYDAEVAAVRACDRRESERRRAELEQLEDDE